MLALHLGALGVSIFRKPLVSLGGRDALQGGTRGEQAPSSKLPFCWVVSPWVAWGGAVAASL